MSIRDYEIAEALVGDKGDFVGPTSAALIESAERVLGLRFPPSYRQFLLNLGCGDFAGLEVYGIVDGNFEDSAAPNGIWITLHERRTFGLAPHYILIASEGDGTWYAIDTSNVDAASEAPVVMLSVDFQNAELIAPSFGTFFLEAVRTAVG